MTHLADISKQKLLKMSKIRWQYCGTSLYDNLQAKANFETDLESNLIVYANET